MSSEAVNTDLAKTSGPTHILVTRKRPVYGISKIVDQMDQTFGSYRLSARAHTIGEHSKFWSVWSTGPNDRPWQTARPFAIRKISQDIAALAASNSERLAICLADGIDPTEGEATAAPEIGAEAVRRFGLAKSGSCAVARQRMPQGPAINNCNLVSRSDPNREASHAMD